MKNNILLTIFTLMTIQLSYSQNDETIEFDTNNLIGIWYLKYNRKNENLTFEKKVEIEHKYGSRIEILKNGEFHNRYSAPCGNDRRLFTDNYNGKWSLNTEEWIITTTEPINHKGTVYKIVELKSDKLVLSEVKIE